MALTPPADALLVDEASVKTAQNDRPTAFSNHRAAGRLTHLVAPSFGFAAALLACSERSGGLSDGVNIPRMAEPLLEGLDPARSLLLFVWERDLIYSCGPGGGRAQLSKYGNS
jgi:hypothetical protein